MSPHRVPGERDERPDVEPLHKGPRDTCPACGAANEWRCKACRVAKPMSALGPPAGAHDCPYGYIAHRVREPIFRVTAPVFCSPAARVRVGWLRRCTEPGEHVHQTCKVCGASWICAALEAVQPSASIVPPEAP